MIGSICKINSIKTFQVVDGSPLRQQIHSVLALKTKFQRKTKHSITFFKRFKNKRAKQNKVGLLNSPR